jgi:hypothetical protein
MSFFDEDFGFEELSNDEEKNLREEIEECKKLIESGTVYGFFDKFDEIIQACLDNDFNEDGLYLVDALLEIAPYNSEYWIKKGLFLNSLGKFEESI